MATGRKTGGRKKGTPNKPRQRVQALLEQKGKKSPLEFLLENMLNEENEMELRLRCAKDAAPYVHPKLATTTLKGDEKDPVTLIIKGIDNGD